MREASVIQKLAACQRSLSHADDATFFVVLAFVVLLIFVLANYISSVEPGPDDFDDPTR